MASSRTFEDLDLSQDEVKRLGEALKDEKFRKMLVEYAEEISNPENRRKAEEEIAMIENERGMSVQFIHPEPGYVLKTVVDGSVKTFINICQNDKIEKPKANKQVGPDGKWGVMWQIPHSFAPPREDYDKSQKTCKVFDVVFHPDTYRLAKSNERFKKLVEDTALDGIECQFSVSLDKKNVKRPKLKFKGVPQATVIRERMKETSDVLEPDDILSKMPYPYDNKTSSEKSKENEMKHATKKANKSLDEKMKSDDNKFTVPKYTITHRSELDMSEYRNAPDARTSTCPKELVIKIELPLLKSAAQASLDIFEKRLVLESVSPAAYRLDLSLPYRVNEDEGSAKFDKYKKTLTVTLPVIQPTPPSIPFSEGDQTKMKVNDNESTPLIEDLYSNTSIDNTVNNKSNSEAFLHSDQIRMDTNDNVEQKTCENDNITVEKKLTFPQNVKWLLPNHQFSQDNETVSFVINVKNVEERAVEMFFPRSSVAILQFMSIGAGLFPIYYSLYVEFPDGCSISSEHCSVDVSDNNIVFVILKDKMCRGLWDRFSIGTDNTQLEKKQFLTESNLQKELSDLDKEALEEAVMPGQVEMTPELSVVEMNEKRLTIDIKPQKGKKFKLPDKTTNEDEEDYDPPSSAEIEVVHKHPLPDLHSILKQRTVSESSEEVSNADPDSPRSESEELSSSFSKKRSVSFSSHVDHASFKSSASVSSMTPSLKSKRRRQRKREEKRKGRVRCNSEGGTSSSEEYLHSILDSYTQSDDEEGDSVNKPKDGKKAHLRRAISDPGPGAGGLTTITEGEKALGEPGKKAKRKNKSSEDRVVIHDKKEPLDFRTRNVAGGEGACVKGKGSKVVVLEKNESADVEMQDVEVGGDRAQNGEEEDLQKREKQEKNKKIISEIRDKLADDKSDDREKNEGKDDSDDDGFVDAVSSLTEEFKAKVSCNDKVDLIEELESVTKNEADSDRGNDKSNDIDKVCEQNGKSGVETILSWEESSVSGEEHMKACAVQFSNSIMFDLDVE